MLTRLSITEKISATVAACVIAALAIVVSLKLNLSPSYSDFIVGHVTWYAGTKFQDLVVGPICVLVFFIGLLSFLKLLTKLQDEFGSDYATKTSNQLIWWSVPSIAVMASLFLGAAAEGKIIALSALGTVFVSVASIYNRNKTELDPDIFGLCFLSSVFVSFFPLEVALILGRLPMRVTGDIGGVAGYIKASYLVFGFHFGAVLFLATRHPVRLLRYYPKFISIGQIGLPVLLLTLYPAKLSQPTGEVTAYETTIWLKVLIVTSILFGIYDVIRRYRKYGATRERFRLLSPLALFSFLIFLRVGSTLPPTISPDDYHFGEHLLGWWSYLKGAVPYLDYVPAHGLMDNDFRQFVSFVFYDGTAASIVEAERLSFAILAFVAFISIYFFSSSVGLAFSLVFFLGGAFFLSKRLAWLFLTPFLCLWFSETLRRDPAKWLIVWGVSAPLAVLGVPPQGLILVAASSFMALFFAWCTVRNEEWRSWGSVAISSVTILILGVIISLSPMLFGAVRYVLENGAINQVAYGVPWNIGWNNGSRSGFVFEIVRMSWVFVSLACAAVVYVKRAEFKDSISGFYPALVVLLITIFLIPYSMGRIDPGAVSRPGLTSIFCWCILLPIAMWSVFRSEFKAPLILLVAFMSSLLNLGDVAFANFASSISERIVTPPLRDGKSANPHDLALCHGADL